MTIHELKFPTLESDKVENFDYQQTIRLPISAEIAKELQIEASVTGKFDGMVLEVGSYDGEDNSVSILIQTLKLETGNEFEELSREDDD